MYIPEVIRKDSIPPLQNCIQFIFNVSSKSIHNLNLTFSADLYQQTISHFNFQDMVMVIPAIFSDFHHPIGIDKSNKTHFCLNFKFLMCLYQTVDVDFCFGFRLKRVRNV